MDFTKKLLIAGIIVIFTIIVWQLLYVRIKLFNELNQENFSLFATTQQNEFTSIESNNSITIQHINSEYSNLPLREYCIKSSYNSAFTGNYINLDMLQYVINRGCRFLDFEVYYISDEKGKYAPMVSYSTDNTFMTLGSENSILLDTVLSSVAANSFSPPCPNYKDPVIVNLRIKSNNMDVYKAVAASIDNTIRAKLYVDRKSKQTPYPAIPVTDDTLLSEIMGSIIISVDKTIVRDYKNYTSCNTDDTSCYDLTNYINIESGSEELNLVRYSDLTNQCVFPINILNDNIHTTAKTMKMAVPDTLNTNTLNPNIKDFILNYGCQNVFYRFYKNDKPLKNYENFFNDNKSAFVPLANAIPYFQQ
jgi:hypothetical protein